MRLLLFIIFSFCLTANANAQKEKYKVNHKDSASPEEELFDITIDDRVYSALVTETGDTLILTKIEDVTIRAKREFENSADKRKYNKMKRYAKYVYPYAQEIIKIYREIEYASENMSRRQRKKEIKRLEKLLMPKFEESMKKMTKLQGKIMLKMVEKETNKSTYGIIKEVKGKWQAYYWHQASKLYSYNLKEGYEEGKYPILDMVLADTELDLSYKVKDKSDLKYIDIKKFRRKKNKK